MQVITHRAANGCPANVPIQLKHKKNSLYRGIAALLSAALSLPSFANEMPVKPSVQASAVAIGETLAVPSTSIQPGLAGSFLASRFARQSEDLKEAAKYLSESLKADPDNESLKQEAMRTHLLAGNVKDAVALAMQLAATAKRDPLVATLLMLEAIERNDMAKAEQWAATSPEAGLYGIVRPMVLEWIKIARGEVKKEVNLKTAVDKSGFFAPFMMYHVALMNDVLGNIPAARAAYEKSSADPAITPYRVAESIANFYARMGEWDKAQAVFDAYAKANPDSSLIPPKLVASKEKIAPVVANPREGLAELFFTTASILFGEEATQDTFLYLRIALALKSDLPPAQLMLANLYEQVEDYSSAIAAYDNIAKGSVFYRRGQIRKALNFEALGKRNEALALLGDIATQYPDDNLALITRGDMLREDDRFGDAIAAYSEAIRRVEPLGAGNWPLLYARGISHERAGQWEKAEADFSRALVLEPHQPDVLNYLAYSWLVMNKNIGKAREYLEIALLARPDDPHIIDSMGWAEYLAGNFPKAVEHFEKAVEMMPDDPTINNHLGDAYWRVGRQTEAKFSWQRALDNQPEDEADIKALKNKLENGLPPFLDKSSQLGAAPQPVTTVAVPGDITVQ